jgi:nucleoside-diphosphate-sugar epimerase
VGGKRNVKEHMSDMTQNLIMFKNLTLQMMGTKRPFINFGSGAEYYHNTYYAASKREICELGLRNPYYYHIRVFGCFGIHEEPQRFIKSALTNYINKQPIVIHGNKQMDFIYIDDLYLIIQNILNGNVSSGEYNAVYDSPNDLYNLAQFINELDNYNVDIIVDDVETIDYTCAESDFDSYKFTGIFNGIKIMYNQMKENTNG